MIIKKVLIIITLLLLPFIAQSQSNPWEIGVNVSPFLFGKYQSESSKEVDNQGFPNGFLFGFTIEKNFNKNWGVYTSLEYSFQNLKEIDSEPLASGTTVDSDFEYLKLPVMAQYSRPVGASSSLYLILRQGFQVSRLIDYYTIRDNRLSTVIYDSAERYFYGKEKGIENRASNQAYRPYTFGVVGSAGLKKHFSDHFSYSFHIRYEFDITNSDDEIWYSYGSNHNYRVGLVLGIQYKIGGSSEISTKE